MLITKKTTSNVVLQVHMIICIKIYNHFLIRTYLAFINKQCRQVDRYCQMPTCSIITKKRTSNNSTGLLNGYVYRSYSMLY